MIKRTDRVKVAAEEAMDTSDACTEQAVINNGSKTLPIEEIN